MKSPTKSRPDVLFPALDMLTLSPQKPTYNPGIDRAPEPEPLEMNSPGPEETPMELMQPISDRVPVRKSSRKTRPIDRLGY